MKENQLKTSARKTKKSKGSEGKGRMDQQDHVSENGFRCVAIPIKLPWHSLQRWGAGILKLIQKHTEASGSHKITLSKMDNAGRILTTTFKLQFRATVTKVVWYPQKKKHSGKDLRTQI